MCSEEICLSSSFCYRSPWHRPQLTVKPRYVSTKTFIVHQFPTVSRSLFEVSACTRGSTSQADSHWSSQGGVGGQSSWHLSDPRLGLRVNVGWGAVSSTIHVCHYLLLQNFPFLQFTSYKDWLILMSHQALNTCVVAEVPPLWCCEMAGVGSRALQGSRIVPWVRTPHPSGPSASCCRDVCCSASRFCATTMLPSLMIFLPCISPSFVCKTPQSCSPHRADHFSPGAASLSLPLTSSTSNSWSLRDFTMGDIPLLACAQELTLQHIIFCILLIPRSVLQ